MVKILKMLINTLLLAVLSTSCASAVISIGPKREAVSYYSRTIDVKEPVNLHITCDNSNIEVYSCEKKEIRFDITKKVRGIEEKAGLEKKLNDFSLDIGSNKEKVFFISKYKGSIKSPADKSVDLKVYLPKFVSSVYLKLDVGTIKMYDDIECSLNTDINMANTEINSFEGKMNFKANLGNLKIAGGKIYRGSGVTIGEGNISIKSEVENEGIYNFTTEMGNIDVTLPVDSQIGFENLGKVEINEFEGRDYPVGMRLNSNMGKISIKKY